jgi:hypothetical protein
MIRMIRLAVASEQRLVDGGKVHADFQKTIWYFGQKCLRGWGSRPRQSRPSFDALVRQ